MPGTAFLYARLFKFQNREDLLASRKNLDDVVNHVGKLMKKCNKEVATDAN